MNLFDLLVVILVVYLGFTGFREGLVRGGVKLAGFLLTVLAVSFLSGDITRFAAGLDGIPRYLAVPAVFFAVFAALTILFSIIAEILHRTVHLTPLGAIDSGLGTVFGILKALFISGILALVLSFLPGRAELHRQYATSRVAPKLVSFVGKTIPAVTAAGVTILKRLSLPVPPERENRPKKEHGSQYSI